MKRPVIISLMLLLLPQLASAIDNDVQLWTEAGLRYKINKQLRLKFDQHFRLHNDVSEPESIMPELAISYRVFKALRLQAGYRLVGEFYKYNGETYISDWHRFYADVRLRLRFKPVTLRYRLRFQEQTGWDYDPDGDKKVPKNKLTLRNKITLQLKYPYGFMQFLSVELFNRLADEVRAWHKLRTSLGLRYSIKSHEFTIAYRLESYLFNDPNGEVTHQKGDMNHVLSLGYHYSF